MSERATVAHAPGVVEPTQRYQDGSEQRESAANYGADWPLAAMLGAGVLALYVPLVGFAFVLITSVRWQHLLVGGALAFLLSCAPLFVVEVQQLRRRNSRAVAAPLPAPSTKRIRSSRLSSDDALGPVQPCAEWVPPNYERAALRYLGRHITEGSPTLQHFAQVTASLAQCQPDG